MDYIDKIEKQVNILEKLTKTATSDRFQSIISEYDSTWGMLEDFIAALDANLEKLKMNLIDSGTSPENAEKIYSLTKSQVNLIANSLVLKKNLIEQYDEEIYNII